MSGSIRSSSTSSKESLVDTVRPRTVVRSGIGGAGNYHQAKSLPAPPPLPPITTSQPNTYTSGIGGAGNKRSVAVRADVAYDEELRRSVRPQNPTVSRSGIGGIGNIRKAVAPPPTESSPVSNVPLPYGALDLISRKFSKVFSKSKDSLDSSTSSKSS